MSLEQQSAEDIAKLRANIELAVLGKPEVVKLVVTALLAGEHILLEDVPGVGKTLIAKALAKSLNGRFSRLQFTPDLLPSDITGSSVYNSSNGQFSFNPGPIFANIVLADEVNRAPPRTQSALLEAMGESQVSVDGETHKLPRPLLVMATQNPFEYEGTYLLPESQLDRFLRAFRSVIRNGNTNAICSNRTASANLSTNCSQSSRPNEYWLCNTQLVKCESRSRWSSTCSISSMPPATARHCRSALARAVPWRFITLPRHWL
ncbi:MAG: AAA family ATPase [Pirellulaceae bacterium]